MEYYYHKDIDLPGLEVSPKRPTRVRIKLRKLMIVGLTALLVGVVEGAADRYLGRDHHWPVDRGAVAGKVLRDWQGLSGKQV